MTVRPTQASDIPELQGVLDSTQLFPSEMLLDMLAPAVEIGDSDHLWLTVLDASGVPVGFCYAVPEQMADGTWNMLAIAVDVSAQRAGHGGKLVAALEDTLRQRDARILIADTSGVEAFAPTRAFYVANGYAQEARIREFWGPGDDKVVFWKALG